MSSQVSNVDKYFNNDTVFNGINKTFVSLQDKDIEENNIHLQKVIYTLLEKMQAEDIFFRKVYQKISFGGSYYKKTKVGSPDEFDLNIIIKLPFNYKLIKIEPCYPGFVRIHSGLKPDQLKDDNKIHRTLRKLLDPNMYLNQEMLRRWMESILNKTVSKLQGTNNRCILLTNTRTYAIKITKTGPAFTLNIEVSHNKIISVDLVPALELVHKLPNLTHNLNNFQNKQWYAVPKPLDNFMFSGDKQLYWRTCLYEQEKEILSKNGQIKPVLRQMKKLRDTQNWKHLASYYIETVFLHALQECTNLERKSNTFIFMIMLQKLHTALKNRKIPYYWNTNFNLLIRLKSEEMENIERRLGNIINCINKNISSDSFIIANYILNAEELLQLKSELRQESSENEEPEESGILPNIIAFLRIVNDVSSVIAHMLRD